jgi:hypothetical protein
VAQGSGCADGGSGVVPNDRSGPEWQFAQCHGCVMRRRGGYGPQQHATQSRTDFSSEYAIRETRELQGWAASKGRD